MADKGNRYRGHYKRNRRGDNPHHHKQRKEDVKNEPIEMTPALQTFKLYQTELDSKHDRYERLVKISRDVTIESKRIIFLLHRIEGDPKEVLGEAEKRLTDLQNNLISKIAQEIKGQDIHQFMRAFSAGMQEYIEAVAFYLFVKEERLVSMNEVTSRLTFTQEQIKSSIQKEDMVQKKGSEKVEPAKDTEVEKEAETSDKPQTLPSLKDEDKQELAKDISAPPISLTLPPLEIMLGLADFTGELMRLCINTVGSGDLERPFQLLEFMRHVSEGFQLLGNVAGREMVRKASVMRQSLKKMEDACYVIKVRGSEIPKHMLKDAIVIPSDFHGNDGGYEQDEF